MNEPGAEPILDPEEREMILQDIRRMDEVVSRFLQYGTPPKVRLVSADLNAFLRDLCSRVRPRTEAAGVRLRLLLDPDLPKVFLDCQRMAQAVENLCVNALQAVPPGGEIRIRTGRNGHAEGVRIEVEDTGGGIDEQIREHLFEPFYTTRQQGSGLGLSIVYQVIQEHGGQITVTTEKGKGSRFTIRLPQ